MKIGVIGTGYQGLVTGTCLAENGHQVLCMDRDSERIARLNRGELPLHEPGLEELVIRNMEEERLRFTDSLDAVTDDCLMVFLCVGAPVDPDGRVDTSRVLDVSRAIARHTPAYRIIVNKTTCPPGTADRIEAIFRETASHPVDVVVNPDFMKEGSAVDDFLRPDRVVVGSGDVRVIEMFRELYRPFLRTGKPFLAMSRRDAEMVKYANNLMLAARISVMNQLADLCEALGCDIDQVREAVGADARIGPMFLFPGLGFGGMGLPRDVATCAGLARERGIPSGLLESILEVNRYRRERFLQVILDHFGGDVTGKHFAFWGAAFKPRTDDLRGAPALDLIAALVGRDATVRLYDPVAGPKLASRFEKGVELARKVYEALENADALVITTEWNEFRRPDYERMASLMRRPVIFDGRNLFTPSVIAKAGFWYYSVGRPPARPESV
ncbi:MAG TPA: UDP-glucose/GDP-mannose dehydrogenase family protein [Candidatus Hydrogenedentes bacterium]|nr:UDP-glucose/GDP-mannose dehydrogenase family protein [Candidatus Hydrogenedentota bacterium]